MKNYQYSLLFALCFALAFMIPSSSVLASLPQFTNKNTKKERKNYAQELSRIIEKMHNSIPSPSPEEKEWIENELDKYQKTKNYKILMRLKEKTEYSFFRARYFLAKLKVALDIIMNSNSESREMLGWTMLIEKLLGSDGDGWNYIYDLYQKKYIDAELVGRNLESENLENNEPYIITYQSNCSIVSWQILRNIIRPYFEKKTN